MPPPSPARERRAGTAAAAAAAVASIAKASALADAASKDALAKNTTKIAELEKARSESAARVNELTAEVAKLRDGSEVRDANAKSKKSEADLEAASSALREANSKMSTPLRVLEDYQVDRL